MDAIARRCILVYDILPYDDGAFGASCYVLKDVEASFGEAVAQNILDIAGSLLLSYRVVSEREHSTPCIYKGPSVQ